MHNLQIVTLVPLPPAWLSVSVSVSVSVSLSLSVSLSPPSLSLSLSRARAQRSLFTFPLHADIRVKLLKDTSQNATAASLLNVLVWKKREDNYASFS